MIHINKFMDYVNKRKITVNSIDDRKNIVLILVFELEKK